MENDTYVLGQHSNCDEYFCSKKKTCKENWIPQAMQSGMLMEINNVVNRLVFNSKSLIMNNNICEQFNSVISKRINLSQRNTFNTRVENCCNII